MFYDNYASKFIKISMIYQVFLFDNFFYKCNYISVKNQYNSKRFTIPVCPVIYLKKSSRKNKVLYRNL